ncbi:MAG: heme exporter protein CcmB [Acidimicrobiales bacterium]|nr:heme exporter protein CcmB [Acidimicrobiales bacterium]
MWREIPLVLGKDLRIEVRSRVLVNQVAPFTLLVIVLFGFALDADTTTLRSFSAGLFWVAVLLSALLAIQRAFAIESADGATAGLRLSGLSPSAIFLGKAAAIAVQLLVLELLLSAGIVVFYDAEIEAPLLFAAAAAAATLGIAAAGTLYGVLAAGLRVRETILPILLLPVLAPVLIAATRAFDDALGSAAVNGWAWTGLLVVFAVTYIVFGTLAYGVLLEET